jgi:hypothetical protein
MRRLSKKSTVKPRLTAKVEIKEKVITPPSLKALNISPTNKIVDTSKQMMLMSQTLGNLNEN